MAKEAIKKAAAKKAAAKEPPKKIYLVVASIEMSVEEMESTEALIKAVEDKARLLKIPLSEVAESGNIKAFVGTEVQLATEKPQIKATLGS